MEAIRQAARALREATSLRRAAAAIGLKPSVLGEFLKGSAPQPPTLAALCGWYVREQAGREGAPEAEAVEAALVLLLGGVPPKQKEAAARRLVALAERVRGGEGGEGREGRAR